MATLARINVTAVKGTALSHPDHVELTPDGIPANRRFHLADLTGRDVGVFDAATLVTVRCDHDRVTGALRCVFPDGTVAEGDGEALGERTLTRMSEHDVAGREVTGPLGAAFSEFLGRQVRFIRADRDVDGSDVEPLTLVSHASVQDLAARGGLTGGKLDAGRFRMSFELSDAEPYEEDSWEGQEVRIGEAVIRVGGQVPRCRVTNHHPTTGERDFPTLTTITSYRPRMADGKGIPFGVYATVLRPGVVRTGDDVALLRS